MNDRGEGWIQTYTGRQFWPLDPRPEDVELEDIAHALSMMCRFTGHTKQFYSVAEHSVHVSRQIARAAAERGLLPETCLDFAMWGLLHDASEAYLIDLARPVKRLPELAAYRDAEHRVMAVICERFGLRAEEPGGVHVADMRMLATEAEQLMAPIHPAWRQSAEPYSDLVLPCWNPNRAKEAFLTRFAELKVRP